MLPKLSENILNLVEVNSPSLTYEIDFENKKVVNKIDKIEALKQAIFLTLNVERFSYEIYSFDYGVELIPLFGTNEDILFIELERFIREALLVDDRIKELSDFEFSKHKKTVNIRFRVHSMYGQFDNEVEVSL